MHFIAVLSVLAHCKAIRYACISFFSLPTLNLSIADCFDSLVSFHGPLDFSKSENEKLSIREPKKVLPPTKKL